MTMTTQLPTISNPRTNLYCKPCETCRSQVKENQGYIVKNSAGYWTTFCKTCFPFKIVQSERRLTKDGWIQTPYEPENLSLVRSFPGARFNGDRKQWSFSLAPQDRSRVLELANRLQLQIDPELLIETSVQSAPEEKFEIQLPEGKKLFGYQEEGIRFLSSRKRALLGDDMGLGKTGQSLLAIPKNSKVVIVCPSCVKGNWAKEARMWRPDLKPVILKGKGSLRTPETNEMLIVNYDILPADIPEGWASAGVLLIADEAHMVKNNKANRSKRLKQLTALCDRVWFLTGTPLLNRPFDIWGVLSGCQLEKDAFGSWTGFLKAFGGYENRWGGHEFSGPKDYVAEKLRNVMLRRLKKDVLKFLPPRITTEIPVGEFSRSLIKEMDAMWDESEISLLDADDDLPGFEQFSKIRAAVAEEKLPALIELVEQYEESETPILVFSAHRKPALEIGSREGWACINGTTTSEERTLIVDQFQSGKLKGVALTIQAGGVGLTLTRASTVIMNDLDWTPALNEQAISRIDRIGQNASSIEIVHLVADHPLERHIHKLLTTKIEMQRVALDNAPLTATIKKEEAETQEEFDARMLKMAEMLEAKEAARKEKEAIDQANREQAQKERAISKINSWDKSEQEFDAETTKQIIGGFQYLCSVCDGAIEQDGSGFNGQDAFKAKMILFAGDYSPSVVRVIHKMIQKYKRQIKASYPLVFKS